MLWAPHASAANFLPTGATDPLIESATFSRNIELPVEEALGQKYVGILNLGFNGWGLVYRYALKHETELSVQGGYKPENRLMTKEFKPTPRVAHAELTEIKQYQFDAGLDHVIHLTSNKRWGLMAGLGLGIVRAEYHAAYYKQPCGFYCGYDPTNPVLQNTVDLYARLNWRLGFGLRHRQVWGAKGAFNFLLTPTIKRVPDNFKFVGPGGQEVSPMNSTDYVIEALIEI